MDWITVIMIYIISIPGYHYLYNDFLINLSPQISLNSIQLSLSDYLMMKVSNLPPSLSTVVSTNVDISKLQTVCLLLRITNEKFINSPNINLLEFYFQILNSNKLDKLLATFQLITKSNHSIMNQLLLLPTLKYINQLSNVNKIELPLITPSLEMIYIFMFTLMNNSYFNNDNQKVIGKITTSVVYPSCILTNFSKDNPIFCVSFIDCEPFISDIQLTDYSDSNRVYRRYRRDTSPMSTSNTTNVNSTTIDQNNSGLSPGLLTVAIIIPIIGVACLAVGGYFLYRWLHSRRSAHGIYHPNQMENKANILKEPEPQTVIKIPQEERLI
ncbi:unnamed protein product [Heterobilharzia americana]|nr:unnamed protein product [Heterobilharzia americana]